MSVATSLPRVRPVRRDSHAAAPALDALYRRFHRRLLDYLRRRIGDQQLAEDLAHEAIVRFAAAEGFDEARPAWPYLKTIARNLAIDTRRHLDREVLIPSDQADRLEDPGSGDLGASVVGPPVRDAIATLPTRQRTALELRFVEGWDVGEVADHLGITRGALVQLSWRARHNLASVLEDAGHRVRGVTAPLTLPLAARLRATLAELRQRVVLDPSLLLPIERVAAAVVAAGVALLLSGTLHAPPGAGASPSDLSVPGRHAPADEPAAATAAEAPGPPASGGAGLVADDVVPPAGAAPATGPARTSARNSTVTVDPPAAPLPANGTAEVTVERGDTVGVDDEAWVWIGHHPPVGGGGDLVTIGCGGLNEPVCDAFRAVPDPPQP